MAHSINMHFRLKISTAPKHHNFLALIVFTNPNIGLNIHKTYLTIFVFALYEHVLKEVVVVLLHLLVSHVGQVTAISCLGWVLGVDVQILQQNSLNRYSYSLQILFIHLFFLRPFNKSSENCTWNCFILFTEASVSMSIRLSKYSYI